MSFITIVCINYKNVTYMNQGHKVVSLVDEPGTQLCVPGCTDKFKSHILPGTRDSNLYPKLCNYRERYDL